MNVDIRYPIGKFQLVDFSAAEKESKLADILFLPRLLEFAILNLNEEHMHVPYREGGWTINQIIHHVADSHMNAFIRFKLALTEDNPVIKPYDQDKWAEKLDVLNVPVNMSITLLHSLHARWGELIKSMTDEEWQRTVFHPEQKRTISLWEMLIVYAWHGKHHATQITNLREQKGW